MFSNLKAIVKEDEKKPREMAEIAVNIVIDKLVPILVQETKLLRGVRKEMTDIKDELESIGVFLRDADGKAETNDGVKIWVKQVRKVAYRMEDVIDDYVLHLATYPHGRGFVVSLQKGVCFIKNLKWRHQMASEIQDIKTTIIEVRARSERYGFNSIEGGSSSAVKSVEWDDPDRLASLHVEEANLVGIVGLKQQLVACATKEESSRIVISLVGMGGVGKTTIAKKVYDSQEVTRYSDCKVWIAVSESYKMEEILRATMKQLYRAGKEEHLAGKEDQNALERIDKMEGEELIGKLKEYLLLKRYFIVFDDVWAVKFWRSIQHALPTNEKGSRIFITTRSREVASSCVESLTHFFEVQPLSPESAWELFCKKVFRSKCPEELEEVSRDIVKKCQGLPLAIVVIGGLLSKKNKVASEWQKFHDSLRYELENNPHLTGIKRILLLSYNDLLYCLKPCFLYFALFPEDYSIRCGRLIRLWIAEGFAKETKGKTLEDVAGDYLNELVQRSLVQISSVKFDGRPRECQVHDLMREILLSKYEELNFCCVLAEKNDLNFDRSVRRLSMHNYGKYSIRGSTNLSKVRSILVFGVTNIFGVDEFPKKLIDYRLLKILDLEDTRVEGVPGEVGNLFHLKYFSLRNTRVRMLPKSIGKLHNLETLDLKRSCVRELPIEITRLHKLRHLLTKTKAVKMPEGIGSLESLQKLYLVVVGDGDRLVKELKRLRQLRKLRIENLKRGNGVALCAAIENMNHLFSLSVASVIRGPLDMQSTISPPLSLQRLYLGGMLEKLPGWISKLRNLTRISLNFSNLLDDPLNVLQNLPNLLELILSEAYDGELLYFKGNGFQKLKVLDLSCMDKLSMVMIDQGALPRLETLRVWSCSQLKEVPSGIHCLTRLRTLHFRYMPNTLPLRMQPDGGPDHWKVKDIPTIMFDGNPFRMTKSDPQSVLLPLS